MKSSRLLLSIALLVMSGLAFANTPNAVVGSLDDTLRAAMVQTGKELESTAILWLSSFIMIQFVVTNMGHLKTAADMEQIWAKFVGSMIWFGFCFYVMSNGAEFIDKVSQGFFSKAAGIAGTNYFSPSYIINLCCLMAANLIDKLNDAAGITNMFLPSMLGGLMGVVIIGVGAYVGFKIFLIKVETAIIVMMAPLSFALLGLNAFRDQGIAPFKSLLSLLYRIILLAVIVKTMKIMVTHMVNVTNQINEESLGGLWDVIFFANVGLLLIAFLAHKSDAIAASLASGSTQLGSSDAAAAAALGAAIGGAIGATGAGMGKNVGAGAQTMSDWLGSLGGGAGVSNASSEGTGGAMLERPSPSGSMSVAGEGGGTAASSPASGGADLSTASSSSASDSFKGVPNPPTTDRDKQVAARQERRAAREGSGSAAAISSPAAGDTSGLEKQVERLAESMQGGRSMTDRIGEINQHIANEGAATHVSINTHHE